MKNSVALLTTLSALSALSAALAVTPATAQLTPSLLTPSLVAASALPPLAAAIVAQGPGRGPRFGPPSEEEKERFRIRIGISKEQQAEIDKVFRESDLQMQEIRKRSGELSRQLYSLYDIYDFDRGQAKTLRRELLMLHKRMADLHAENEEKLRRIMTREQFDRMRALVREEWDKRRKEWEKQRASRGTRP